MRLPTSFGKQKKPSLFMVRRVVGKSMQPTLRPGQLVLARPFTRLRPGDIVVLQHAGLEKVKRVTDCDGGKVYVQGDNLAQSTDSRQFGWLPVQNITAKVIWPRYLKKQ